MLGTMATVMALVLTQVDGTAGGDPPVSLRGSPAAMEQQHRVAREHGLDFYETEEEIRAAVARGDLVEVPEGPHYQVADFVTLPYLHAAARLFVERTAALYTEACGDTLVVTSGVRAIADQPPNAHSLSVHPAGIAVDLRVSAEPACREWLEERLRFLEERRLINGIREFRPPHYHVAVFPEPYLAFARANPVEIPRFPEEATRVEEEPSTGPRLLVLLLLAALTMVGAWAVAIVRGRRRGSPPG